MCCLASCIFVTPDFNDENYFTKLWLMVRGHSAGAWMEYHDCKTKKEHTLRKGLKMETDDITAYYDCKIFICHIWGISALGYHQGNGFLFSLSHLVIMKNESGTAPLP